MSKRKDHIVKSEDYQRYLEDKMTPKERHDFEKRLLEDDFAEEAYEGFSQLTPEELTADVSYLKNKLYSRTKKSNVFAFWRMAAALMLLGIFSFMVYYLIESNTTREIVQTKSIPVTEESDEWKPANKSAKDSSQEEPEPLVAYQKKMEEAPVEKQIPKSNVRKATKVTEKKVELGELEMLEIADDQEEPEEISLDMEVTPTEMTATADMQAEPVELDAAPTESKRKRLSKKSAAPSAMSKMAAPESKEYNANVAPIRTITGKVSSEEDDEALPGVNVIVKGTSIGTVSDIEGNYSIDITADQEVTLVYSYIGFNSEEVVVGEQTAININIEPDITSLSEIVVTGYAARKKSDVTGAVSTVDMDEFENREFRYDPPKPVGGNGAFKDYVKENIQYPESGLEEKINGTVKLKFTIERTGNITNIEVLKSMGEDFDQEAIRLLKEGPIWEPAKENDSTVAKEVKVKIRFRAPE